jgi:CubicO group peptidase (beta-lactamase class C family)
MMKPTMLILAFLLCGAACQAQETAKQLPRSVPELQGVSSKALLDFIDSADRHIVSLHSFMLVRHGHVVTENWWAPYDSVTRHELYSLSKSFTSTAVGMAIAEGKLSLDDEVTKFFPDDLPASPGPNLKSMRVRDLLRMATGHDSEPKFGTGESWTKTFLAHRVAFKPGTHFMYNTPATYMLSAIVQKQTGMTVLEYLKPRLFEPVGIENPTWGTSPQGISLGGYGLSVRTEDIAKFGLLYLQKGKWNDQQLMSPEWVEAATAMQVSNGSSPTSDWDQGYGFQFWRCRHGYYRGDGAFGQYCIVMPDQDAVIAITSGVGDMQSVLNLVWDKLLPAFHAQPLPDDRASVDQLAQKSKALRLPLVKGETSTSESEKFVGKKYSFDTNDQKIDSILVESNVNNGMTLVLEANGIKQSIPCGFGDWHRCTMRLGPTLEQSAATSGAWTANNVYTLKICLNETPYVQTMRFTFDSDQVAVDSEYNVSFGPTKRPQIVGHYK